MRVALLEANMMWSVRIRNGLKTLGHEVVSLEDSPDLVIIDLASTTSDPFSQISELKRKGTRVIAHVGHKDKELWRRGEEAGCDKVVSNGTIAKRMESVLADVHMAR